MACGAGHELLTRAAIRFNSPDLPLLFCLADMAQEEKPDA